MEVMRILEDRPIHQIYGLMGNINITTNNSNYSIVREFKFSKTVKEFLNSEKDLKSLQIVGLNASYLPKLSSELSNAELKKVILAHELILNKPYLIFDYFEKDLTLKEKENFKRLFRLLVNNYQKTIVVFTNDLTFIWDIASTIFYVNAEKIISFAKKDYEILNYVNNPPLSEFIKLMQKKGIKIANFNNASDLLKEIYRLKEKK